MIIKIKNKNKPINVSLGWCFKKGAYDEDLIEKINSGKEVEIDFIPFSAEEFVKKVIKRKKGAK
tara:strand:+ start:252 stop:443 length:192 start_codon:yes stop_codon:yes gene_type:complete